MNRWNHSYSDILTTLVTVGLPRFSVILVFSLEKNITFLPANVVCLKVLSTLSTFLYTISSCRLKVASFLKCSLSLNQLILSVKCSPYKEAHNYCSQVMKS